MGCSSSKSDEGVLPNKGQAWGSPRGAPTTPPGVKKPSSASRLSAKFRRKSGKNKQLENVKNQDDGADNNIQNLIKTDRSSSQHSLSETDQNGINRGVSSATSKTSTHTHDSGLEEDFLPNMITEQSELDKQEIANDRPPTPDLGVVGTGIDSRQTSGKSMRSMQSSNTILDGLRSEGLLAAFGQKTGGSGIKFEVMIAPEFGVLKKPPTRLKKLKKIKKQKELTHEELEAKMKAAEERRKRKEAKMIAKLNTSAKELQHHKVANTQDTEVKEQAKEKVAKTLDKAAENRQAHLNALREKLEEKKRRAEKVRLVRLERLAEGHPTQEDDEGAV